MNEFQERLNQIKTFLTENRIKRDRFCLKQWLDHIGKRGIDKHCRMEQDKDRNHNRRGNG